MLSSSAGQPSASPPVAGAAVTAARICAASICTASSASPTMECAATHRRATSLRSSPLKKPSGRGSPSTFISILKRCVAAAAPASAHQSSPSVPLSSGGPHWRWAAASAATLHRTRRRHIAAIVAASLRRIPSLRGCPLSSLVDGSAIWRQRSAVSLPSQQAGAPPTSPSTATTTRDAPRTSPSTVRNLEEFNDHLRLNVARAVNAEKTERA